MMHFMQFIVKRMHEMATVSKQLVRTLNIAVVPAGDDTPLADFTSRLVASLSTYGKTLLVNSDSVDRYWGVSGMAQKSGTDPNSIRLTAWLEEQSNSYTNIVYEADPADTPWTRRCLQNADRVMIVARSEADPQRGELERVLFATDSDIHKVQEVLVLIHPDGSRLPTGTDRWLQERQVDAHYHVRWDRDADFHRLARILTGNAVGLVLGGGGARGLAHIGVIRALNEAGIPIDMVGGTSMGSMIASLAAMGLDYEAMVATQKMAIGRDPFKEFCLPFISLVRSRRLDSIVKEIYGELNIEDMWVNYFSVSTNLTTAEMMVHRKGNLGRSVRASAALPGIVRPVVEDNCLLVDGGLFNNVPADIMKEICGGFVIMVNVSPDEDLRVADDYKSCPSNTEILWSLINPFKEKVVFPRIHDIMMRTITVGSARKQTRTSKAADFSFRPPIDSFGMLEFDSMDKIVEAGYQYAKERINELQMQGL
jgi:predicted acylesterase/phospholipase RssA